MTWELTWREQVEGSSKSNHAAEVATYEAETAAVLASSAGPAGPSLRSGTEVDCLLRTTGVKGYGA
jgi:hypothetical protein